MSQKITEEVAATLAKGTILYHNILEFNNPGEEEKFPATCKVSGKFKKIAGVEGFELPIKRLYCGGSDGLLTRMSQDLWRTTPEKIKPVRIHRERSATAPAIPEPPATEDDTPVARVRRTRTTVTGRIVDDHATLLQNGQQQLLDLASEGTRTGRVSAAHSHESNTPKSATRVRRTR